MRVRETSFAVKLALVCPGTAKAHVAEGGFVLLLPTEAYTTAGVAVVALTVVSLFLLPDRFVSRLFSYRPLTERPMKTARDVASLLSLAVFLFGLYVGVTGPRDPLSNLLPLGFWTVWWIGLVSLAGFAGNLWAWINPWTGLYRLLGPIRPLFKLPDGVGDKLNVGLLLAFACFLLADIAPEDPARLANVLAAYWLITMTGLVLCGPAWLQHAELGHAMFRTYARLAALRLARPAGVGGPGWQAVEIPPGRAAGLFALTLLAVGSFDGLNGTFWWLATIGVNPLEFPGRSAVVTETIVGLLAFTLGLVAVFALAVWIGLALVRADVGFGQAFNWLGQSLLPIALAYHIAHYLTAFLVTCQYTVAAVSDPFATGADWLGIQPFYVTTGFFNQIDSVRLIWLSQAGIVVLGHVWSVWLGHRIAQRLMPERGKAALATLPLSILMIAYTFLGLWLLATPRGV